MEIKFEMNQIMVTIMKLTQSYQYQQVYYYGYLVSRTDGE